MIDDGRAPTALRTPISRVRSCTEISMMLLTPTTPARMVPRPMIQTKTPMPTNSFWNFSFISWLFQKRNACLSSAANPWRPAMPAMSASAARADSSPVAFPTENVMSSMRPPFLISICAVLSGM